MVLRSRAFIHSLIKSKPTEIEIKASPRLYKRLAKPPIVRYRDNDYICRRVHIDKLLIKSATGSLHIEVPVNDYWLRAWRDFRIFANQTRYFVFNVSWE